MVFENLTLFEVSLEGAQLGPRSLGRADKPVDADVEMAAAGGRRGLAFSVVLAIAAMGLGVLWFRSRGRDAVEIEDEAAEADLAAAQ